jgi:adenylate cyclase
VIGRQRIIYDLWGDTVSVASRMASTGIAGRIQVTQAVRDAVAGRSDFDASPTPDHAASAVTGM